MEYMNPFAGSMFPESVPNNPFVSRLNQLENREMMAPFMGMEMQRQQAALRKQQVLDQEFMSPEATALRTEDIAGKRKKIKLESAEADAKLENMPQEQKIKLIEFKQKIQELEGKPQGQMLSFLTDQVPALEKAPEQMKQAVYAGILQQFKMTHPGIEIPADWQQYSPEVGSRLSAARLAKIMTPAHVQELEKVDKQKQAEIEKAKITAGGTVRAAEVHEAGADRRKKLEIDNANKQSPGQFRVTQRRVLSNPSSTPEQLAAAEEALTLSLVDDLPKLYQGDSLLSTLAIKASSGNPEAVQAYETRKNKIFEDHLVSGGVRVRVKSPDGKVGTIPKSKLQEALKAGYKQAN